MSDNDDFKSRVRGAVARGWCSKANELKEFDADLASSIFSEVWTEVADRIEALEAALKLSDEALNQMIIWMPSGFAPQSQANAMRLAYEARKVIARAALAEEQDK